MTALSTISSLAAFIFKPASDNSAKTGENFKNFISDTKRPELSGLPFEEPQVADGLPFQPTPVSDGLPFEPPPVSDRLPFEEPPVADGQPFLPTPVIDRLPVGEQPVADGLPFLPRPVVDGLPFEPGVPGDKPFAAWRLAHMLWSGQLGSAGLLPSDRDN